MKTPNIFIIELIYKKKELKGRKKKKQQLKNVFILRNET